MLPTCHNGVIPNVMPYFFLNYIAFHMFVDIFSRPWWPLPVRCYNKFLTERWRCLLVRANPWEDLCMVCHGSCIWATPLEADFNANQQMIFWYQANRISEITIHWWYPCGCWLSLSTLSCSNWRWNTLPFILYVSFFKWRKAKIIGNIPVYPKLSRHLAGTKIIEPRKF